MATGTDSRNITKIVRAILQSNGIDNLKLEADLFGAWMRYVNERDSGQTPAEARAAIAAEYSDIGFSANGQDHNITRQEFMDIMHIDFGTSTDWDTLLSFLVARKKEGQEIQAFADWCKNDPYNSPKLHQIAQKPLLVKMMWSKAFENVASQAPAVKVDEAGFPESY